MNKLAKAISIAAQAFETTWDKGGHPYILHCLTVMRDCNSDDEDVLCAAVLHDLLEDKSAEWDAPTLRHDCGFSERTVELICILTHDKEYMSYDDYIKRISLDHDAIKIKLADLRHNTDITRMKDLGKKDFDRLEKYHRAYKYLSRV